MTPDDLIQAWPDGVPQDGHIVVTLHSWVAENTEFVEVLDENIRILGEALTKAFGLFQDGFGFALEPQGLRDAVWTLGFSTTHPASDVIAYCLNGVMAVLSGFEEPMYSDLRVQGGAGAPVPHKQLIVQRPAPMILDTARNPVAPEAFAELQMMSIFVELPQGSTMDEAGMETAMWAIAEFLDVGVFDLPGFPQDAYDLAEPSVGYDVEGMHPQIGVAGFRGDGSFAPVLIAAIETVLGATLQNPVVVIEDEGLY